MADRNNPEIALTRERIREALARQDRAEALWLPNFEVNPTWQRHDGQIQRFNGEVHTVSRSSLFVGGGPTLDLNIGDALYAPLAARQLTNARVENAKAASNDLLLEVSLAYTDLMQGYAELEIAEETYQNAKQLAELLTAYEKVGKTSNVDTTRAETELYQRDRERILARGRVQAGSIRLAQLLNLPPSISLRPAEPALVPLPMVPEVLPLPEMIAQGILHRPEMAENQSYIDAALQYWRSAKVEPFVPKLGLGVSAGGFGGGPNDFFGNFDSRSDVTALVYWRLENLGLGNLAKQNERESLLAQANHRLRIMENRIVGQIAQAYNQTEISRQQIPAAENAIKAARESHRLNSERIKRAPEQARPLEILQPIQALNRVRLDYLQTVADYNRAQFRLYAAMGNPPQCALDRANVDAKAQLPAPREVGK